MTTRRDFLSLLSGFLGTLTVLAHGWRLWPASAKVCPKRQIWVGQIDATLAELGKYLKASQATNSLPIILDGFIRSPGTVMFSLNKWKMYIEYQSLQRSMRCDVHFELDYRARGWDFPPHTSECGYVNPGIQLYDRVDLLPLIGSATITEHKDDHVAAT